MSRFVQPSRFGLALLLASAVCSAAPAPIRILVAIGSDLGDPSDVPLRFAESDARRVRDLFVELGNVAPERAYLLLREPALNVRARMAEVTGRIAELAQSGREVTLIVFVSAHASGGTLRLVGTQLPISELRAAASATLAQVRLVVVDSCDSAVAMRKKGGRPGQEYALSIERIPLRGEVVISSSGPAEPSQEWDLLEGSLFTHHLVTGLRGDADLEGDGRVTLAEAYSYAYRRTVAQHLTAGQHPALDVDLVGTGELILTEPARGGSALIFPPHLEGRFVVASRQRPSVVAEVEKLRGKRLRLAIPPGRYLVRKAIGRKVLLAELELSYGGERTLEEGTFEARDFTQVATKGGQIELRPFAAVLLGGVETAAIQGTASRLGASVALRRSEGEWWGSAGLALGRAHYRGVNLSITEDRAALTLSAGHRWWWGPLVVQLGLSGEAGLIQQTFWRDGEEEIQTVLGVGSLPSRSMLALAVGPQAAIDVPLGDRFFLRLVAEGQLRHFAAEAQPGWTLGARVSGGFGVSL